MWHISRGDILLGPPPLYAPRFITMPQNVLLGLRGKKLGHLGLNIFKKKKDRMLKYAIVYNMNMLRLPAHIILCLHRHPTDATCSSICHRRRLIARGKWCK